MSKLPATVRGQIAKELLFAQAEIQNMNARSLATLSGEERLTIEREAGTLLMTLGYSEKA